MHTSHTPIFLDSFFFLILFFFSPENNNKKNTNKQTKNCHSFLWKPWLRLRVRSSSNWILMSCQPHRVTSGQSNSGHKQIHISKLFSHQPSVKSIYKTNHFANIKHTSTNIRQNFQRVSPFNITPVKRAHTTRTCWYSQLFHLIYRYQVKEKYKKEWTDTIYKKMFFLYKCIMANTSPI